MKDQEVSSLKSQMNLMSTRMQKLVLMTKATLEGQELAHSEHLKELSSLEARREAFEMKADYLLDQHPVK
jgi:hypothetical protein